ncbi:hypothetical protein AHAS_Ahas18G0100100 [Arachis hypogaea]
MATLENMAAAMQATAEALGNQINQGNHGNNNDEDGPMTLATFLKVRLQLLGEPQIPLMQIIGFRLWKGRCGLSRFLKSNGLNLELINCKVKLSIGGRKPDVSCSLMVLRFLGRFSGQSSIRNIFLIQLEMPRNLN